MSRVRKTVKTFKYYHREHRSKKRRRIDFDNPNIKRYKRNKEELNIYGSEKEKIRKEKKEA